MWSLFAILICATPAGMVLIPGGQFRPTYPPSPAETEVRVEAFHLDIAPVTNAEFLTFVQRSSRWRRGTVSALFADRGYLAHWAGPLALGSDARPAQPETRVSWFAAKAYCEARGARLPYEREWERAAAADESSGDARAKAEFLEQILTWYSRPTGVLGEAGKFAPNHFGVRALHGLVWEWVLDFGAAMTASDSREGADAAKFCGGAGLTAGDKADYAAFMRIAFRSSLQGSYSTPNLGFRCAMDAARRRSS